MALSRKHRLKRAQSPARTVLIIDDDTAVARSLKLLLSHWGLSADSVTDPIEVDGKLAQSQPEIIFLDYRMQPLTGKDILIRLKEKGVRCPVVVMTAYATASCCLEFKEMGAAEILPKPFGKEEIEGVLRRLNLLPGTGTPGKVRSGRGSKGV